MRPVAILLGVALLVCASFSQNLSQSIRAMGKAIAERGAPNRAAAPAESQLPQTPPRRAGEPFVLRNADHFDRRGNSIVASGDVRFSFRGYDVVCDRVEGDLRTNIFTMRGNVILSGTDQLIRASSLLVDFDRRTFRFLEGSADLGPSFIGGNLTEPIYIRGQAASGSSKEVEAERCGLTTCDHDHPHFELVARRITIRPTKRAILRDVDLRIFDKSVLRIPYLVLPLNQNAERQLPEVGQSRDEGYFIKTKWPIELQGEDLFTGRLDYYTKLGNGFGGDYDYSRETLSGLLRAYTVTRGTNGLTAFWNHRQLFGQSNWTVNANYQKNNYTTAPDNTQVGIQTQYTIPNANGSTSLSIFRNSNESTSFRSINQSYNLSDQRRLFRTVASNLALNLTSSENQSGTGPLSRRSILDLNYTASQELRQFTTQLEYRRSIPITADDNFFSSSDRTPTISIRSTSERLFGPRMGQVLPFGAEISIGEIANPGLRNRITRIGFAWDSRQQTDPNKRLSFSATNRFRQTLYSDDTAQYLLGTDLGLKYQMAAKSSVNLRYNYLRPYGYTPLTIDNSGTTNIVGLDVNWEARKDLNFSVQTGYDIQQLKLKSVSPWQNILFRIDYAEGGNRFRARTTANYDNASQIWRNIRTDFSWQSPWGPVSGGVQYDAARSTWSNVTLLFETFKFGKVTTSALLSYNGYLKKFEATQFQVSYDLHCTELVLQFQDNTTGFRSGREIQLFLRLKAFPLDSLFGTGRRGQSIRGGGIGF